MASSGHFKLLKRKLDGTVVQIGDDFSDFSLSSPATKIRRLDPELPPIVEEEGESLPVPNDERALVLFKPMNLHSPSDFSLTLSSDLISHIKNNQLSWSKQCDYSDNQDQNEEDNRRLAIVPWVPQPSTSCSEDKNNSNTIELMEADEMGEEQEDEGAMMDVEQEDNNSSNYNYPAMLNLHHQAEGFQQHCFLPQIPQNTSTPITWTR
ncbi:hypothetical protein MtrunA17_Chr8g0389121 [Medicago truncatula]|uniref:Uncharacterized protein n=1 Tax=Medicago truncatula TaxID=3880 RepID=G7LIX0_MEDTR|nr:uncharacterized protein LOC11432656 [Medicago truncatula]AET05098.1 hypothetical protein MTR_8g101480 [Medicago truncatula]RHN43548.1 hypothetical protein MtrunA17_Chr8g0389121 [Medicago truncatula]